MALKLTTKDKHIIEHVIGICYHKLGDLDKAIATQSDIYYSNSKFHDALISRGNIFIDFNTEKGFKDAQKDYETVLIRDGRNIDAHINLAYLFQITGKFKRAWQQFTTAMEINQNVAAVHEGRSIVCLQMSNMDAAMKDINRAINLKPSAELFVNRGVINQVRIYLEL
jgi:tetratricopeptide (TPR) repeat protein